MPNLTTDDATTYQPIRAPRGSALSCKGWQQEAALRMLMNNLDPEVAEKPEDLIVYGGRGKAARNWNCYHAIVRVRCDRLKTTKHCSFNPANRSEFSAPTRTRRACSSRIRISSATGAIGNISTSSTAPA